MLKKLTIFLLVVSNIILLTPNAKAATKVLNSDFAKKNYRCNQVNQLSLSKEGPLTCSKGVWKLILSSRDSVASRAYRSLLTRYESMPGNDPNLVLRIDPKAGKWKSQIVRGVVAAARLWGTSNENDAPLRLYISEKAEFVSDNLAIDGIQENPEDAQRNLAAAAQGLSQAGFHGAYFDFIFTEQNTKDKGFFQVGPHEYTHYAQRIFSNSRAFQIPREFWLEEGCAQFIGTNMGGLIDMPQNQRESIIKNVQFDGGALDLNYFSKGSQELYANPKFNKVYDIGSVGCEAIVAVAGVSSIENLFRQLSIYGEDYDSASRKVLSLSLTNLVAFAQAYLDSIVKNEPLSLNKLNEIYKKLQIS